MPSVLVAEIDIETGNPCSVEGGPPDSQFSVAFEDDGRSGYFYALDLSLSDPELSKVVDALCVYEVSMSLPPFTPLKIQLVWSVDGLKAAVIINGTPQAAFDFSQRCAYSETGFPPPRPIGQQWTRRTENWAFEVNELFADTMAPQELPEGRSVRTSDETLTTDAPCNAPSLTIPRKAALDKLLEMRAANGYSPIFPLSENRTLLVLDSGHGDIELLLQNFESRSPDEFRRITRSFLLDVDGRIVNGHGVLAEWEIGEGGEGEQVPMRLCQEDTVSATEVDDILVEIESINSSDDNQ